MAQFIQVKQSWHLQFIRARKWLSSLNVFWVKEFLEFIFCNGEFWTFDNVIKPNSISHNCHFFFELIGIIKTKSLINILTVVFIV